MKDQLKDFEKSLEDCIINEFQDHSGNLKIVLRMLPITAKIEVLEYITHRPITEQSSLRDCLPAEYYPKAS